MPQRIEVPGEGIIEFPDGMTDDQISQAIRQNFPNLGAPSQPAAPDPVQTTPPERAGASGTWGDPASGTWEDAPKEKRSYAASEVPLEALKNLVPSAVEGVSAMAQPLLHPINTAKALGGIAAGGLQKGAKTLGMTPTSEEHIPSFDALMDFLAERYGGWENIKRTAAEDPFGSALDLSTILGVGGAAAGKVAKIGEKAAYGRALSGGAGKVSPMTQVASTAEKALKAGSKVVDPVHLAAKGADALRKVPGKLIPESLPRNWYASAMKFNSKTSLADRDLQIAKALQEGVLPDRKGLEHISNKIDQINREIGEVIDQAAKSGDTVNPGAVASRLDQLKSKFSKQVLPGDDLALIEAAKQEFLSAWRVPNKSGSGAVKNIPVRQAQEMKVGTYKQLKSKAYGELKNARIEAEKALGLGLKEELAAKYPELAKLNADDSVLIALEDSIEAAVKRIENKDMVGIGSTVAGAAGAAATGRPSLGFITMAAKSLIDNPMFKGKVAIALDAARRKAGAPMPKRNVGKAKALFQAGRLTEEEDFQKLMDDLERARK